MAGTVSTPLAAVIRFVVGVFVFLPRSVCSAGLSKQ
jgi:hypothetical protein